MMTKQQEIYWIICIIIKNIINSLVQIYQDKKIQALFQQNHFIGKLQEDNGVTRFFIAEKQQKAILNFSLDSLIVTVM